MSSKIQTLTKTFLVFLTQAIIFLGCDEEEKTIIIITEPSVRFLESTKVLISWETNVPGNSVVEYGINADLDSLYVDDEERQFHEVTLTNLAFNTIYYYRVTSESSYLGKQVSSEIDTFTTSENIISIVTGPIVEFISSAEVIITWDTDTLGNSIVEYGLSTVLDSLFIDDEERTSHSVTLSSLVLDTLYYYRVTSVSLLLDTQVSSNIDSFTTIKGEINILSLPVVEHISPLEVVITWDTDVNGNSIVDYGITPELSTQVIDSVEGLSHGVTLTDLTPNSTYYYQVTSISSSLNAQVSSEIDTFTTSEGEINILSLPVVEHISPLEVIITWDTDVNGNSIVDYGITPELSTQVIDSVEGLSHDVILTDLTPNTTYYYQVTSISSSLNAQVSSEIDTFTTSEGEINILSLPVVEHISPLEVIITWDTDVNGNSIVDYGITPELGMQVINSEEGLSHGVTLTDLTPYTTYYYQVTSISSSLNAQVSSEIDTFTTMQSEINIVTEPSVEYISSTEVLVNWDTDVQGNSIVDYGITTELGSQVSDSTEELSHSISLTGLIPSTTYYFEVTSISSLLNAQVSSAVDSFSTSGSRLR